MVNAQCNHHHTAAATVAWTTTATVLFSLTAPLIGCCSAVCCNHIIMNMNIRCYKCLKLTQLLQRLSTKYTLRKLLQQLWPFIVAAVVL